MEDVKKYLNDLTKEQKTELNKVRNTISQAAPSAEEVISYGMPVYKYKGKYLVGVAGFKDHMSIFPGSGAIEHFKLELKDFKTSKGTIQFSFDQPLPKSLLIEIVKFNLKQID